jgi:hypothetical protein
MTDDDVSELTDCIPSEPFGYYFSWQRRRDGVATCHKLANSKKQKVAGGRI